MSEFEGRRNALLDAMGDGVAVFPSAPLAVRNHDVEHPYRQDSDLYYLTGFDEPESVLVLTNQHDEHRCVMFVRPRKRDREIWDGPRAGVEGAVERFGADAAFPIEELAKRLPDYLGNVSRLLYHVGANHDADRQVFDCLNLLRRGGRRGVLAPDTIITDVGSAKASVVDDARAAAHGRACRRPTRAAAGSAADDDPTRGARGCFT